MPKTKKPASSSDSDSGPEDRNPVSKKPKPTTTEKKPSGGGGDGPEGEWHIEGMRYLKVREFRGRQQIDIREYYEKDGEILPGKKGIALTPAQWKKVLGFAEEVNKKLH
ncbi:RNA polymerase II transcriptional coactivator [Lutzomyia longipalpis]|uniref:Transcriptional coactivator p15 (PC4) C-terminal domain-containing protein n=2 Tax=Lutzomyia longipalpis TaxID=7200 RepID=A0A1B0CJZ2_LUTLO|nr:RNA polymerase II transcriptional coactivator [Lutzomyia longipalpis]